MKSELMALISSLAPEGNAQLSYSKTATETIGSEAKFHAELDEDTNTISLILQATIPNRHTAIVPQDTFDIDELVDTMDRFYTSNIDAGIELYEAPIIYIHHIMDVFVEQAKELLNSYADGSVEIPECPCCVAEREAANHTHH